MTNMEYLPRLTITGGSTGQSVDVRLNGREIPGLRAVRLEIASDDINIATFECQVGEVDVDVAGLSEVLALHDLAICEKRLPWWKRVLLWLKG
ncbi:hypothetical protein [Symbiobacterium thermophilum]|uniref:Uncharacterized protein n=1 Tax=Symbiobacterium thermophilum TaxID=2734 RepID=A0A953I1V5_SYMTR|nr:hypothetical protein [Symbiobacterium thermophilum]MBY6275382.1 hypothetical protein [Symbiobacterium thermophilum]